jgi:alkylation response protein AidB-like acyl-CoA dehydrogenase
MTTTMTNPTSPLLGDLLEQVASIGPEIAAHAARHDADASVVVEGVQRARDAGLLSMAVPVPLGGLGAGVREVAMVQRALAHFCGSTALATAMHQHSVCFAAWRYRRGLPGAEAALRRVADGAVIVTTGGADFTQPRGRATKVNGGYCVSGRKIFCSLSPLGDVLSTMFPIGDDGDRRVLNVAIPMDADGVRILDTWNTMGMRGTGSNDVVLADVFVREERVLGERPYGVIDPALQVVISMALPIISGAYLGIAEAAYRSALDAIASRAAEPGVQRQVGSMAHRLRIAAWALDGALEAAGDDPEPSMEVVAAVSAAKNEIAHTGIEVCDGAMELAGGPSFYKGSVIERCYRDIRAAKFHPFTPETTLTHAGRVALGLPADVV